LRILVYSAFDESIFAERAMRAGAGGYVMKRAPKEELAAAIRDIVKDGIYVSREVALSGFRKSLRRRLKNSRSPRSANRLEKPSAHGKPLFHMVRLRAWDERNRAVVAFERENGRESSRKHQT